MINDAHFCLICGEPLGGRDDGYDIHPDCAADELRCAVCEARIDAWGQGYFHGWTQGYLDGQANQ
jgi:hypothetical protein